MRNCGVAIDNRWSNRLFARMRWFRRRYHYRVEDFDGLLRFACLKQFLRYLGDRF